MIMLGKWSVITPTMGRGRGRVSEEENGVFFSAESPALPLVGVITDQQRTGKASER